LTARALSLKQQEPMAAAELAVEAAGLSPTLIPAAALAGTLLGQAGERRRAARVIEAAWRDNPHPDLACAYVDLVPGASARDRLDRMRTLIRLAPDHRESALALGQAAIEAHEFAEARAALKPFIASPTRRVAGLMAQLEDAQGDIGRAREWMARMVQAAHDPAWMADGLVTESWMPISPVTGRLDAFQWCVPAPELPCGPLIEPTEHIKLAPSIAPSLRPSLPEVASTDGGLPIMDAQGDNPPLQPPTGDQLKPAIPCDVELPSHDADDPSAKPSTEAVKVVPASLSSAGWRQWFSRSPRGQPKFESGG
jgi:HemY protein